MEIIRYINGERVAGTMPALKVGNPGLREILKALAGRVPQGAEASRGAEAGPRA